ncbi:hypothetical protein BGZ70_002544 [Mortierella alpina]|uniref:GAF domain-containing protein n=1 Tax=Mortierella alpina TaxID=64518 RepID=A0A9P6IUC3_MORAP|nr:hypothetical protein BGZ70_002544 [Mortierella alpina]
MTPNITASTASSKAEFYEDLESQIQGIVDGQLNWVTNLANASALIYHGLRAVTAKPINWAGFYVLDKDAATSSSTSTAAETQPKKDALILGPFQGKVACTNIVFGRGVCGTAAAENRTLVVKDVHDFPGHIACDSASSSEIVVPLELNGRVIGVLDLDCEVTEGFDEVDQAGLEAVAKILVKACDWRVYYNAAAHPVRFTYRATLIQITLTLATSAMENSSAVTLVEADSPTPSTSIEQMLDLEEIDKDLYRSKKLWVPMGARGVFGGNVVGQALVAATNTVSTDFSVHSLHSYFLLPGDPTIPILYHVERVRDGRSYSTRTVTATQRGQNVFVCTASFQVPRPGAPSHQYPMPDVPHHSALSSQEYLIQKLIENPKIPEHLKAFLKLRLEEVKAAQSAVVSIR